MLSIKQNVMPSKTTRLVIIHIVGMCTAQARSRMCVRVCAPVCVRVHGFVWY